MAPTGKTTRITRLRLKTKPPIISKPGQNTKKLPASSPTKTMYAETGSTIEDVEQATTIRVASGDTTAGAATAIEEMEAMSGSKEQMCNTIQLAEAEQEAGQEAPVTPPLPPKRKIKIKSIPNSTVTTKATTAKAATTTTPAATKSTRPTTALSAKPARSTPKTRTRSIRPRTSGQGNIIKTSRPAANDFFLYGKRLNLLYDDGFQQMRDFWEDFGACVDVEGRVGGVLGGVVRMKVVNEGNWGG